MRKKSSTAVRTQTHSHTLKNSEKWEMETHTNTHTDTELNWKSWKNCANKKILVCLHSIDVKSKKKRWKKTVHRMCAPKFKHSMYAEMEKEENEFEKKINNKIFEFQRRHRQQWIKGEEKNIRRIFFFIFCFFSVNGNGKKELLMLKSTYHIIEWKKFRRNSTQSKHANIYSFIHQVQRISGCCDTNLEPSNKCMQCTEYRILYKKKKEDRIDLERSLIPSMMALPCCTDSVAQYRIK